MLVHCGSLNAGERQLRAAGAAHPGQVVADEEMLPGAALLFPVKACSNRWSGLLLVHVALTELVRVVSDSYARLALLIKDKFLL